MTQTNFDLRQKEMARALFGMEAIQFGAFRLKLHETNPDAPLSRIYVNLRTKDNPKGGPLSPEIVKSIGEYLHGVAMEHELRFDRIAGVPYAGDPLAKAFSEAPSSGNPISLLELHKQIAGERRRVEGSIQGYFNPHETVLLVDDLVTRADSKLEAIQLLEAHGLRVRDVLVVLDREQGGAEQLAEYGCNLHVVFKLSQLLRWYREQEMITSEQYEEVTTYLKM